MKSVLFFFAALSVFSICSAVNAQDLRQAESTERDYIVLFDYLDGDPIYTEQAKTLLRHHLETNNFLYRTRPRTSELNFKKTYSNAVSGVLVSLEEREAEAVSELDYIKLVEPDSLVYPDANWGLDRLNQVNLPLDSNYNTTFTGQGADIYIIDTGINQNHTEFAGRIGDVVSMVSGGTADCNGHGTHVASLAAGATFGVASDAAVHSIRISNVCSGSATAYASDIVDAFDWVRSNGEPSSVINYSYTSSSSSIRLAMDAVVFAGHVIVTSAGNDNTGACSANTNKTRGALIIGSTNSADTRSSFSNYDSCISLFSPGSSILGANYSSNTGSTIKSGTSMASPFVAGIAATYRGRFPNADPYEVMEAIIDDATAGVVSGTNGSPNRLAYTEIDPPTAYWQISHHIFTPGPISFDLPAPGCSNGSSWPFTLGYENAIQMWINLIYMCQ